MADVTLDSQQLETLLPRRYQEEVFTRAQKGNIIAALNTGSGKTLISLLLIKWTIAKERSKGKVIIFLVPKVTLVEQQSNYIDKNTPDSIRVMKLHGALDIDLGDRAGWKKRFEEHEVFVMTAQIFLNILTHSVWSIDKVSLMIFDECHHARKNHPYNGIMREYFHVPSSRRPKIFGMTASPIWNVKDPAGSLATLEQNMDAKVIGVRDHIEELVDHSPKPIEVIEEYPLPPEEYDYPFPTIYMCLQIFHKTLWDQLEIPWSKIEMRYFSTLHNLGPYCASLFLYLEIQHHLTNLFAEYQKYLYRDVAVDIPSLIPAKRIPLEIFDIDDIVSDFQSFFSSDGCPAQIPIPIPLAWCSPKVESLVKVLLKYSSPTFQGIIFVEQRQVASTLGRLLEAVPELQGTIRCAHLVGQGVNSEGVSKHSDRYQGDAVKLFRDKEINILIATSVAEEGLDFPACDLVVRFDPLQHLVGYVQSRGRARNKASTFIIMIQKDDLAQLTRYKALQEGEPEINRAYQTRHLNTDDDVDDDDEDMTDLVDLAERERYVVPSTGAILSYDNAINLIHHLCALIPRDAFTPPHQPTFTGYFQSTMRLPPSLPLPPRHLSYLGPPKRSKKEARRAVAFCAVKRLRMLDVFDDYLLPISSQVHEADKQRVTHVRDVPAIMTVSVRDPWCMGSKLWIHPIFIDGCQVAGLVTGTKLPPVDVLVASSHVRSGLAELLVFHEDVEFEERKIMHDFTKLAIWYRITSSPFVSATSLFLIPLTSDNQPDFHAMTRLVDNPWGLEDWDSVTEDDCGRRIVMSTYEKGRTYLLKKIRDDLSPMSVPPRGSLQAAFPTYYEYFVSKWTRKNRKAAVPVDGPLLEVAIHPKSHLGSYSLIPINVDTIAAPSDAELRLLPQGCTRWIDLSFDLCRAFEALPVICRRVTDVYRIQCGRFDLGLPLITENLLIEAFTLPSSKPSCNNQRMETLGDAVLQICTTVHLLNAYPNRHEGQLSELRSQLVSNNYLLARAKDVGLERFLTSEVETVFKWRYTVLDDGNGEGPRDSPKRYAEREFPRRSLQDCMEAVLGASFLTGGVSMALATGTALGLAFGGPHPWWRRYPPSAPPTAVSALFEGLETSLGYKFHHNHLILEAVTHPSFSSSSGGPSYQRLEFLGDALLDLVVIKYLYDKFPSATSHELAFPRTRTICAQTLAHVAVKRLGLHNIMLVNCPSLTMAINGYVPMLKAASSEEIVKQGWKYDPPKALSDVFESVMGAIFVDTGYDYDKTASVVEYVMEDVLSVLSPSLTKDPVSDLLEWAGKAGCRKVVFGKEAKSTGKLQTEGVTVSVHGNIVVGPIISTSLPVAKYVAAERAMAMLKDGETDKSLAHLCDCGKHMETDNTGPASVDNGAKLNDVFDEELDAEDAAEVDRILTTDLMTSTTLRGVLSRDN